MEISNLGITGLTDAEVVSSREKNGTNTQETKSKNLLWESIKTLAHEPMVLLLLIASTIYFVSGDVGDGLFLGFSILLVAAISLYQDRRTQDALENLKKFTHPFTKVIRNSVVTEINTEDLVIGDFMISEEGTTIAADGDIVQSNDFTVNESILTGESMSVSKNINGDDTKVYQGTMIVSGLAISKVTAIGSHTELGKIGKSLDDIVKEKTPLETQIGNFVKKMVIIGAVVFLIVWAINYSHSQNILDSLLKALTLAMSILPEEIPVAFTTFMALGAWRLMKMGVVVKQMKTVETLGSATVICTDKTGTITQNKMSLAKIYTHETNKVSDPNRTELSDQEIELISLAMWSSEPIPFDPMETTLHQLYGSLSIADARPDYHMIHEYPLGGKPPMMTHIFENKEGHRIVAAKGAPEALLNVSSLQSEEITHIQSIISSLAKEGYRILGVGIAKNPEVDFPKQQQEFKFDFKGLIAFYDPPKKNIESVFQNFYKAGIDVKIITGDNALTTSAIARQVNFRGCEKSLTGDELMSMSDEELAASVQNTNIFTRMFPEAKLRIINALKSKNEIVAMIGDGVNDGPALKASHIGIAMGKKGTEIAKEAATLILVDDDLSKMVDAVAMGRRIYSNLKKAIQYIISIHIPIILTVFTPLAFGWIYPNIFTPVHVIFLELIMGPTCSIIYENEPSEKNILRLKPRPLTSTFFSFKELMTSVIQGLVITVGTLLTYQYAVQHGYSESLTRTMVFTTLISANIWLTFANRSFYYSIWTTWQYKNNLVTLIIVVTIVMVTALIYINPLAQFFQFSRLNAINMVIAGSIGFASVIWYEVVKFFKRRNDTDISENQSLVS